MSNYPDGMTASDWRHVEGDPRNDIVASCEEQGHQYNRAGYCQECGEPDYDDAGQDPDDARDAQMERDFEAAQERGE